MIVRRSAARRAPRRLARRGSTGRGKATGRARRTTESTTARASRAMPRAADDARISSSRPSSNASSTSAIARSVNAPSLLIMAFMQTSPGPPQSYAECGGVYCHRLFGRYRAHFWISPGASPSVSPRTTPSAVSSLANSRSSDASKSHPIASSSGPAAGAGVLAMASSAPLPETSRNCTRRASLAMLHHLAHEHHKRNRQRPTPRAIKYTFDSFV